MVIIFCSISKIIPATHCKDVWTVAKLLDFYYREINKTNLPVHRTAPQCFHAVAPEEKKQTNMGVREATAANTHTCIDKSVREVEASLFQGCTHTHRHKVNVKLFLQHLKQITETLSGITLTFRILISLPRSIWDLDKFFLLMHFMATSQSVFCRTEGKKGKKKNERRRVKTCYSFDKS